MVSCRERSECVLYFQGKWNDGVTNERHGYVVQAKLAEQGSGEGDDDCTLNP